MWNRVLSVDAEYQSPDEIIPTRITLGCDARTFDLLQVGQTAEARVLEFGPGFKFARLKGRSTFSIVADFIPRSPRGPWREATAILSEVTHVHEYLARRVGPLQLPWPYDIVQLRYTPDGKEGAVIAVDVVETASAPGLAPGQTVRVLWPEDDPRSAKIVGARPGYPWMNQFYALGEYFLVYLAAVIAFIAVIGFLWRRWKRAMKRRQAS